MSFIQLYTISLAAEITGILKKQDTVRKDYQVHGKIYTSI
jgi:hypothetical protein